MAVLPIQSERFAATWTLPWIYTIDDKDGLSAFVRVMLTSQVHFSFAKIVTRRLSSMVSRPPYVSNVSVKRSGFSQPLSITFRDERDVGITVMDNRLLNDAGSKVCQYLRMSHVFRKHVLETTRFSAKFFKRLQLSRCVCVT